MNRPTRSGRLPPHEKANSYWSDIVRPAPTSFLVFIGVHEDDITDSHFGIPPPGWFPRLLRKEIWWNVPTDRHNQGGSLSFADGHVERWRWRSPKTARADHEVDWANEGDDFRRLQATVKPEDRF